MSTIFRGLNTVDPLPSPIDTGTRMFGHTVGRKMYQFGSESQDCNVSNLQLRSRHYFENRPDPRSRVQTFEQTMGYQNRLHRNLLTRHPVNTSTTSRIFSSASSLHQEDNMRLNSIIDEMHQNRGISISSKTFGLIPEDRNVGAAQNNGRYNSGLKGSSTSNSSVIPRPYSLSTRSLNLQSRAEMAQDGSRPNQDKSILNLRSSISRNFLGSDNLGGLTSNQTEGFNQDLGKSTSNSSLLQRPFALQSRTLAQNSEIGLRVNQDTTFRSNNISDISKTFRSAVRNPAGFSTQEKVNLTYNNDIIDNGGFRKPTFSRVIRGRSSTLTSRLLQNENMKLQYKDLSNINGYNVSHISSRDIDTQSDSRLAFNTRSNWVDNQSMSGSVLTVTSMKVHLMNLLENLHHSILNIGPEITAEAVKLEFDRAKQRLENISEMSFMSSVKENGKVSETYQSSKNTCPAITKSTTSACIDGGCLNLKSSKDLLENLISGKRNYRDKFNSSTLMKDGERRKLSTVSSQNTESNEEESVFKKPVAYVKNKSKRKSSRIMKINVPEVVENLTPVAKNKVVNLKEWYPIAFESNLALGGINEEGATVKTAAIKKRVNNRKLELINGLICNLIGSPSEMVSAFPQKIISQLKNGLHVKWRMLQKEILKAQTKQRVSRSPSVKGSPEKKKEKTPKVIRTPKKGKVTELCTRSGRTIKPPSMFWIATNNNEVSSSLERSITKIIISKERSKKKVSMTETPVKKLNKKTRDSSIESREKVARTPPKKKQNTSIVSSRKMNKKVEEFFNRRLKASPEIRKKENKSVKNSKKKQSKEKNMQNKNKESDEEQRVDSSRDSTKGEQRSRNAQGKRKRDANGDPDSVQAKKSKVDKSIELEVEPTVSTSESVSKSGKAILSASPVPGSSKRQIYSKKTTNKSETRLEKKKSGLKLNTSPPKLRGKKSTPLKKKKNNVGKKTKRKEESKMEAKEINESQEDFELNLDDIEIPEIASVSRNSHLSRSQMRLISMETPPLKYFNSNLHSLSASTPLRSPTWCISQRTESEVKQFQKRREETLKKKIKVDTKKTVVSEISKNVQNRDVKRVMEWMAEKTVKSPSWTSKVLQYVMPSRKQLEERINQEDEELNSPSPVLKKFT